MKTASDHLASITFVRGHPRSKPGRVQIESDPIYREISDILAASVDRALSEPLDRPQFDKDGEDFKQRVREAG